MTVLRVQAEVHPAPVEPADQVPADAPLCEGVGSCSSAGSEASVCPASAEPGEGEESDAASMSEDAESCSLDEGAAEAPPSHAEVVDPLHPPLRPPTVQLPPDTYGFYVAMEFHTRSFRHKGLVYPTLYDLLLAVDRGEEPAEDVVELGTSFPLDSLRAFYLRHHALPRLEP